MTPEEFRFASRELHALLNNPADLSSAAELAEELDNVPHDDCAVEIPWLPGYLDTVYGKRPTQGPHE